MSYPLNYLNVQYQCPFMLNVNSVISFISLSLNSKYVLTINNDYQVIMASSNLLLTEPPCSVFPDLTVLYRPTWPAAYHVVLLGTEQLNMNMSYMK